MANSSENDTIDQARLDAGQAILDLTDRGGFDARAAGWLHDRPTGAWRYLLVTPMLNTHGPKWVYERLLRLFRKFDLPAGISPLDIYVIDEAMEFSAFGPPLVAFGTERTVPGVRMYVTHPIQIDGFMVSDGFVVFLRRLPEAIRKLHGNPAKHFDKTIQKLAA
jgi:hypothetical protein